LLTAQRRGVDAVSAKGLGDRDRLKEGFPPRARRRSVGSFR
jgi:hypothetical protein